MARNFSDVGPSSHWEGRDYNMTQQKLAVSRCTRCDRTREACSSAPEQALELGEIGVFYGTLNFAANTAFWIDQQVNG